MDIVATTCFALAILHTFLVKQFHHLARRFPEGSVGENLFHLLGEVEIVFGFWAGVFLLAFAATQGGQAAKQYIQRQDFTEPAFVFVIMVVCSTKPILDLASRLIGAAAKCLPLKPPIAFYAMTLLLGPLLGSFITEPAAMTVTALILLERYYSRGVSQKLMYATLGVLFVNVSIGGTLTPYAAPPVLMVASKWGWSLSFMMANFALKAVLATIVSTVVVTYRFRRELGTMRWEKHRNTAGHVPMWISFAHLVALVLIVMTSHYIVVFIWLFLFFLGLARVTKEYQELLQIREGLLVAFFLGGLVMLGGPQRWWLEPLISKLDALPLYLGAMSLTAITDNAALTYLGSQVPSLTEAGRYALVAGAVVGGGLTVIANAPNPAGYGILNEAFGDEGISPLLLFSHALLPTIIAAVCFWFL